jgi:serine/threonine protein kinase
MSPEALSGDAYSGYAADIWALGVTLYALAYGTLPFGGNSILSLFDSIANDPLTFPVGKYERLRAPPTSILYACKRVGLWRSNLTSPTGFNFWHAHERHTSPLELGPSAPASMARYGRHKPFPSVFRYAF